MLSGSRLSSATSWLWDFGLTQLKCCVFAVFIMLALVASHLLPSGWPRYDVVLAACLLFQALMLRTGRETRDELKVILVFHVLGLGLELYKVRLGSWSYPEEAFTKVGGVPLYSGFMYASVASYLCQAWRRFDLQLVHLPPQAPQVLLAAAIYGNFFWHHFWLDVRWVLAAGVFWLYRKTFAEFAVRREAVKLPLPLAFVLIGFFVWVAENLATLFGAWQYPGQEGGWKPVDLGKFSSWFLLVIVSFIVVAALKHVKEVSGGKVRPR